MLATTIEIVVTFSGFFFLLGIGSGAFMAITDTRPYRALVAHRLGIQWGMNILLYVLIPTVLAAETIWGFSHAHRRAATPVFGVHIALVSLFFWFFYLAQKNPGRKGMRIHLLYAIPCSIALVGFFATGWILCQQMPK